MAWAPGRGRRLATVVVTLVLATSAGMGACASSSPSDGASGPASAPTSPPVAGTPTTGPTASAAPSTAAGVLPPDLRTRPEVAAAIADTASRADVAPETVLIAAWSPVTWNDGSIGCPEQGMSYTQALVDGELLMLRVEQSLFQYHSARGGPFTYCADPAANYTVAG